MSGILPDCDRLMISAFPGEATFPALARRAPPSLRAALLALLVAACGRGEAPPVPPGIEAGLDGRSVHGPIATTFETSEGAVHCQLDPVRTPRSVAMFVGLATGTAPWREPRGGRVVRRPFYDGLPFFRAIPDLLVQSGCPVGDGSGHPGYRVPVERAGDDGERLARPGTLLLARYQPPPARTDPHPPPPGEVIGSQLVITLGDMRHLAGSVTVLGTCADLDVVARIARLVASRRHPVRLSRVTVAR